MRRLESNLWAGLIATSTMTCALLAIQSSKNGLSILRSKPLPPARLTTEITQSVGLPQKLSSHARANLTMLSHFGYGFACAAVYALIPEQTKVSPIAKGMLFGTAVWGASYLGWIPALGLQTSAPRLSRARNTQMILAHLVWGATLGYVENELRTDGLQFLDGGAKKARRKHDGLFN